ncbi:hypothetical protein M501DRAFT_992106 [Patellaria atrata CBS 101060]|uniref:BZIP domain-containing protein n=1 Tax=Patellaria atrata CBS 101060 TaxID=1346257 RepID=A0A9P4SAN3_9PEZI|nr:hypothetical protein M501DRAFT_992106 [Patellaria atrata CBS 101060]
MEAGEKGLESTLNYQEYGLSRSVSKRSVANLSLQELYRKRAVDRENQRALRNKNKNRMRELEEEVKLLKEALEQSERARKELENEKGTTEFGTLSSNVHLVRNNVGVSSGILPDTHEVTMQQHFAAPYIHSPAPAFDLTIQTSHDQMHTSHLEKGASDLETPFDNHLQFPNYPDTSFNEDFWNNQSFLTVPINPNTDSFMNIADFSLDFSALNHVPEAASLLPSTPPLTPSSTLQDPVLLNYTPQRLLANRIRDAKPPWATTPTWTEPTNRHDHMIMRLITKRRGARDLHEFAHAHFPRIPALLNPVQGDEVSSTIARNIVGIINEYTFPERLAWQISPTEQNYNAIPDFMKPTGAQIAVPHPFWVDTIGWPQSRTRLIHHMDHTQYPLFARLITSTFSINWPGGISQIIVSQPPNLNATNPVKYAGSEHTYVLSPAFIAHVGEPANWTVGQTLVDAFPFLRGAVNVRERADDGGRGVPFGGV